MELETRKKIMGSILLIFLGFVIYFCVYKFYSHKFIKKYTDEDFSKNVMKDYSCFDDNYSWQVFKPSFSRRYTNVAFVNKNKGISIITWINIYNDDKEYGLVIENPETHEMKQILIDGKLNPTNRDNQDLINDNIDIIKETVNTAQTKWDLGLNVK